MAHVSTDSKTTPARRKKHPQCEQYQLSICVVYLCCGTPSDPRTTTIGMALRPARPPCTLRLICTIPDPELKRTHLAILMTTLLPRSRGARNLRTILGPLLRTHTVTSPGQPQVAGLIKVGRSPHLHNGLIEQIRALGWMATLGCMSAGMQRPWRSPCLSLVSLGNSLM